MTLGERCDCIMTMIDEVLASSSDAARVEPGSFADARHEPIRSHADEEPAPV